MSEMDDLRGKLAEAVAALEQIGDPGQVSLHTSAFALQEMARASLVRIAARPQPAAPVRRPAVECPRCVGWSEYCECAPQPAAPQDLSETPPWSSRSEDGDVEPKEWK